MLDQIFGLGLKSKANFFRQLAALIDSGMPMMACLEALSKFPSGAVREIISTITPMIRDGSSLSHAFSKFPQHFDEMTLMMIKAGEVGGQLEVRLQYLASYMERMAALQQRTVSKLIYPLVILHAAFFIPNLPILFTGGGIGEYLRAALIPMLLTYAVVLGGFFIYKILFAMPVFIEMIDGFLLYFPLICGYFKARSVYRFVLILGELTDAGIDLDTAVKTAADTCGNRAANRIFQSVRSMLQRGSTLSEALQNCKIFPHSTLQMIHTGEQSGSLSHMLKKTSEMLENDLQAVIDRVFTIIPVLLYFLIAGYVAYTIISNVMKIYAPLMDIFPQ